MRRLAQLKVLVIDPDPERQASTLREAHKIAPASGVSTLTRGLERVATGEYSVVVYSPEDVWEDELRQILLAHEQPPVVLMRTGFISQQAEAEAYRSGAYALLRNQSPREAVYTLLRAALNTALVAEHNRGRRSWAARTLSWRRSSDSVRQYLHEHREVSA